MKTQCPHCQSKFNTADEREGKTAKCPKCGEPFKIVSISAADERGYPLTPEEGKKALYRVSPFLGVCMAGGTIVMGMVIDEPFSMVVRMTCVGLGGALIGIFTFFVLRWCITGSWQIEGKLDQKRMAYTVLGGAVLGLLWLILLRWEEFRDAPIVEFFYTNTTIKIVLLLVNIPAYILFARRVSPSFRRVLAADLEPPWKWYALFHTLVFAGIYFVQYLLIKIIFLN